MIYSFIHLHILSVIHSNHHFLNTVCMHATHSRFSHVWLFATLWTVAHQAPLSMGFSRQEYWVGYHFLLQGIFLNQGLNPRLLHWQAGSSPLRHLGRERCKDTLVPERNFCLEVTWRTERKLEMDEFSHKVMGCYFILPSILFGTIKGIHSTLRDAQI